MCTFDITCKNQLMICFLRNRMESQKSIKDVKVKQEPPKENSWTEYDPQFPQLNLKSSPQKPILISQPNLQKNQTKDPGVLQMFGIPSRALEKDIVQWFYEQKNPDGTKIAIVRIHRIPHDVKAFIQFESGPTGEVRFFSFFGSNLTRDSDG